MWASAVVFFLHAQVVGAAEKAKLSSCRNEVIEGCRNACRSKARRHGCEECDSLDLELTLQVTQSLKTIKSHDSSSARAGKESNSSLDLKTGVQAAAKDAFEECTKTPSSNEIAVARWKTEITQKFERLFAVGQYRGSTGYIKQAVRICEEKVESFCIESEMCAIFCEKSGLCSEKGNIKNQCSLGNRCKPKPPGPSSLLRTLGTNSDDMRKYVATEKDADNWLKGNVTGADNLALDIQTSSQLMQCIAEKREELAKEAEENSKLDTTGKKWKTTGRREVRWQVIQTSPLQRLGVFDDPRMNEYLKKQNLMPTPDEIEELRTGEAQI